MTGNARYRSIVMLGAPGSGKGTQGKVVGGLPGFRHLSMGDCFRALDPQSELGKVFRQYSSQGKLVPDDFTVDLWKDHMGRLVGDGKFKPGTEVLILDGIPRNANQARLLEAHVDVLRLIYLEVKDEEQMVARLRLRALEQKRADDADEKVIRQRFREYEAETAPVLECYSGDLVYSVDAGATPLGVLQQVIAGIIEVI